METESPVIITGTSGEASELERVILTVDMLSANATQDGDGGGLPALIDGKGGTYFIPDGKIQSYQKPITCRLN